MAWLLWLLLFPLAVVVAIEMAVFSVRQERLESALKAGDKRAKVSLDFLANPPQFLSCIQIYSTAIGLVMGALSTPHLTIPIQGRLIAAGVVETTAAPLAYALSLTLVTLATLVFANLVPKQLGFAHAEEVVLRTAWLSRILLWLVLPVALALEWVLKQIARLVGIKVTAQSPVTESDIGFLLEQGRRSGHLDSQESAIVERAFRLSDVAVDKVMTPRPQMEWLDLRRPIEPQIAHLAHSFVPVCVGALDDCVGVLRVRDLLGVEPSETEIRKRLADPVRVPPTARLLDLVELLRGNPARLALVSDEHGHILGAITLNDAVEAILGEMKSLEL